MEFNVQVFIQELKFTSEEEKGRKQKWAKGEVEQRSRSEKGLGQPSGALQTWKDSSGMS